jgi:hypothetical protein
VRDAFRLDVEDGAVSKRAPGRAWPIGEAPISANHACRSGDHAFEETLVTVLTAYRFVDLGVID